MKGATAPRSSSMVSVRICRSERSFSFRYSFSIWGNSLWQGPHQVAQTLIRTGRPVLINVWATWCGPCQRELPHMEKLYRKLKDRSDLQILTLTIDEDLGAVAPFMKEKGYTFPVLPAYSFVTGLLDLVGIPQNWIVDSKGEWRWTGAPAVPDAEWEEAMLKQLESAR